MMTRDSGLFFGPPCSFQATWAYFSQKEGVYISQ